VAKNAQKISTLARSDLCENMVGLRSIICEIEKRKLFFFGKLCKMDNGYLVQNISIHRLFTCMSDNRHRKGCVPEILNILSKYNLSDFLTCYTRNADFPEKPHWKRIVVDAVNQKHDYDWQTCINLDNDFNRFREIHFSVSIANVWKFPTNCSKLRTGKFIAKLISSVPHNNEQSCEIEKRVCKDICIHASLSCPNTS